MSEKQLQYITIIGAQEHNLKNINVKIPHHKLTVITGVSGSGKSSLAFDTINAEGQRRYIETFSAYARNFLGTYKRPKVDIIDGLSPVIAIEQKTISKNPRSTVGTVTEIYDFFRLLYARIGKAYSYVTGKEMVKYSDEAIFNLVFKKYLNKKIYILAPYIRGRKGHYKELFAKFLANGYLYARIDGEIKELTNNFQVDRYKTHFIELVIDKIKITEGNTNRLKESLKTALKQGKNTVMIVEKESNKTEYFSKNFVCETSGISYEEPAPFSFSFNSPKGACNKCHGLGYIIEADLNKIIPNKNLSIRKGAIKLLGKFSNSIIFQQIEALGKKYNFTLDTPIKNISKEALEVILYGSQEPVKLTNLNIGISSYYLTFDGVIAYLENNLEKIKGNKKKNLIEDFFVKKNCPVCNGYRLKKESLHFKIDNKSIAEIANFDLTKLYKWVEQIPYKLNKQQLTIARDTLKEIKKRIKFLLDVGLGYLSLNRPSYTLSGGESQRIRLAAQIGSQLVNVLYIFDEPSIGLHPKDNELLIKSLKNLTKLKNTVIVVEHDEEIMRNAGFIIDLGPGAGKYGGEVLAACNKNKFLKSNTITAQYLKGIKQIEIPQKRRQGNNKFIEIKGAKGHNLKNINVKIPLGKFIVVTGVSGSGKFSLINETLYPALQKHLYSSKVFPLEYESIKGIENINKVINVDQSPIGHSPRSNPATYIGVFTEIRNLFASLPEAKIRGFKSGRFSFNVKGGRCEECKGTGLKTIEMNFLPDVYVTCPVCMGKRYNNETLQVTYKGYSINDVLNMTVNKALEVFENVPSIHNKLMVLKEIGLGYLQLGQSSLTLSGGEAQRVKLAAELSKKSTGKTLYILDEPTTGLHFQDIKVLLKVINYIVDKGNTVIVIEHNLDIIKSADWIIDLGPEGGDKGGYIIAEGTPEQIAQNKNSETGKYLKKVINKSKSSFKTNK